MLNFTLRRPTRLLFGAGQIASIGDEIPSDARLSGYGLDGSGIETIIDKLTEHGMTALGEHRDITPAISRQILTHAI